MKDDHYTSHAIPFIDDKPTPDRRFTRKELEQEVIDETRKELNREKSTEIFFNFMAAMGWEESITFYENLLLGKDGIIQDEKLFLRLEEVFIEGIGLLLQEKKVPIARCETVKNGIKTLLVNQDITIRAKIWSRILAGIAQQQSIGEIVRQAVRPLGSPGDKLMQAIHSLTLGVDATLEEATRLALEQTAHFSLLDSLQFLGFRDQDPFALHNKYTLLGQGSVRAAIAGLGGPTPTEAFLLVHAGLADPEIVANLGNFIGQVSRDGNYFPLNPAQFKGLVAQTEEERRQGFAIHDRFAALNNSQLGTVLIPRVRENHGDWAKVDLVEGTSFSMATRETQVNTAKQIVDAAFAQLNSPAPDGKYLINPEFHPGNLMVSKNGQVYLVDCGLVGEAEMEDALAIFGVVAAFHGQGLPGAAAALFNQKNLNSLSSLSEPNREKLISSLQVISGQIIGGTPPELLLSAVASAVQNAGGPKVTAGEDILFRSLQHLAPYMRLMGQPPEIFSLLSPQPEALPMIAEITAAMSGSKETMKTSLPKGLGVGKKLKNGTIITVGALIEAVDLDTKKPEIPNMVKCRISSELSQYIHQDSLMVQIGSSWLTLAEFLKR